MYRFASFDVCYAGQLLSFAGSENSSELSECCVVVIIFIVLVSRRSIGSSHLKMALLVLVRCSAHHPPRIDKENQRNPNHATGCSSNNDLQIPLRQTHTNCNFFLLFSFPPHQQQIEFFLNKEITHFITDKDYQNPQQIPRRGPESDSGQSSQQLLQQQQQQQRPATPTTPQTPRTPLSYVYHPHLQQYVNEASPSSPCIGGTPNPTQPGLALASGSTTVSFLDRN